MLNLPTASSAYRLLSSITFVSAALLVPSSANAQTATTSFGVSLTIEAECTIAATDMAFGTTTIVGTAATATSALTVQCTEGIDYSIGLDAGLGPTATIGARQLTGPGGELVTYSLFQDPAFATVWGVTPGVNTVDSAAATGAAETITVYGRVPSGQSAPAGTYTDTITATITY
jgi:spore coat protein U-like protein